MANMPQRDVPQDNTFERTITAAGSDVRIYARETGEQNRIHGAYWAQGRWHITSWYANGRFLAVDKDGTQSSTGLDLLEAV